MPEMMMFVGVGGSGAKTLAYLHRRLTDLARSKGWDGPLPRGWQFLAIDLPKDLEDADRVGHQLPPDAYRGIAADRRSYGNYDERLARSIHAAVRREYAAWRPDPSEITQPVQKGAGQYRAIGRVVILESFPAVDQAVTGCIDTFADPSTETEFNRFMGVLGLAPRRGQARPIIFVVGSMAGGSGSGAMIDVCDIIRAKGDGNQQWLRDVSAIIYTPQVFETLSETDRRGVEANSLAAISELVAGRFQPEATLPHLVAAGEAGRPHGSRGPTYAFMVGRRNGAFDFADDHGVYEGVARMLEALTLDAGLQTKFSNATIGNFQQSDQIADTNPLRPRGAVKPVSALGYSRLSLGRDTFGTYVSERIAKTLVSHLLTAHEAAAAQRLGEDYDPTRLNRDQMVDAVVDDGLFKKFITDAKLDERTVENNQVLEQLLNPKELAKRVDALRQPVLQAAKGAMRGNQKGETWWKRFQTQLDGHEERFLEEIEKDLRTSADRLTTALPAQLLATTRSYLSSHGLFVTLRLLDNLDKALETVTITELPSERNTLLSAAGTILGEQQAAVTQLLNKEIRFEHSTLSSAFATVVSARPASLAKAKVRDVAIPLLTDFRTAVLEPLRTGLREAAEELAAFAMTPLFEDWATESVPDRLRPAANDIAVEDTEGFPALFDALVRQTAGTRGDPTADVIRALLDDDLLPMRERETYGLLGLGRWVRSEDRPVPVVVRMQPRSLLERVKRWALADGSTGLGKHLTESIAMYLEGDGLTATQRASRIEAFCVSLDQAIRAAQPMVEVDVDALGTVHQEGLNAAGFPPTRLALSPIPVPSSNVNARAAISAILASYGMSNPQIRAAYATGTGASSIEITTQALACHPIVLTSYTLPIRTKWLSTNGSSDVFGQRRRARRRIEGVPLPTSSVKHLAAGWLVGTALGLAGYEGHVGSRSEMRGVWVLDAVGARLQLPTSGPEGPAADPTDILPMLLDAYAITEILELSDLGNLQGYFRLAEVGDLVELGEWVEAGTVLGRAFDVGPLAGSSDLDVRQRRALTFDAALASLEGQYLALIEQAPSEEWARMPRRWDYAPLLHDVVVELRPKVMGLVSTTPENPGISMIG